MEDARLDVASKVTQPNSLKVDMPLQNRVTPTGDIIATAHRGMFTGNRGIIHDPATKTLLKKRWSSPAWITCVCEFRGWRRKVMGGQSTHMPLKVNAGGVIPVIFASSILAFPQTLLTVPWVKSSVWLSNTLGAIRHGEP